MHKQMVNFIREIETSQLDMLRKKHERNEEFLQLSWWQIGYSQGKNQRIRSVELSKLKHLEKKNREKSIQSCSIKQPDKCITGVTEE